MRGQQRLFRRAVSGIALLHRAQVRGPQLPGPEAVRRQRHPAPAPPGHQPLRQLAGLAGPDPVLRQARLRPPGLRRQDARGRQVLRHAHLPLAGLHHREAGQAGLLRRARVPVPELHVGDRGERPALRPAYLHRQGLHKRGPDQGPLSRTVQIP